MSVDSYMNLQLASTEEYMDGQFTGNLGEVLIRSAVLPQAMSSDTVLGCLFQRLQPTPSRVTTHPA